MCVASMVSTDWINRTQPTWPSLPSMPTYPPIVGGVYTIPTDGPTRAEFDALKKEMEELKQLLLAAKKYDEATGQPDCEMEDKVKIIKDLAKMVGVDFEQVFSNHK